MRVQVTDLQFSVGQSGCGLTALGHDHAAAGQNDRAFRLASSFHRAPQLVQAFGLGGARRRMERHRAVAYPSACMTSLGRSIQHGRGGRSGSGRSLAEVLASLRNILDQKVVLGAGARDAYDVHFLKGVVADELGGYLPGNTSGMDGIGRNAGYRVGEQTGGYQIIACPGRRRGHSRRSHVRRPRRRTGAVQMPRQSSNVNDRTAGVAEQHVHAFFMDSRRICAPVHSITGS